MSYWKKCEEWDSIFRCEKHFGKYKYIVEVWVQETSNSLRYWVSVSSGKKRRELKIFEDKPNKSLGGIKALFWVKQTMLSFPKYYVENYHVDGFKLYLCISWADNKRRNIYERLTKEGFYFQQIDNNKTLIKEIK